jgi:hypothetical protein
MPTFLKFGQKMLRLLVKKGFVISHEFCLHPKSVEAGFGDFMMQRLMAWEGGCEWYQSIGL